MATPKQLIERLREEYDVSLREEKIVSMINSLEARLCTDILRPKDILKVEMHGGEEKISLDFDANYVLAISIEGSQIRKSSASYPYGYRTLGNDILFDFTVSRGSAIIEYLKMPKPFTEEDFKIRPIMLGDEFSELYIYYILSRQALLFEDIERLNNYSTIYSEQLKSLSESVNKGFGGSFKFLNVW